MRFYQMYGMQNAETAYHAYGSLKITHPVCLLYLMP